MASAEKVSVRPIVWTARLLSLLVAIATPAVYFYVSFNRFSVALAVDAEVTAVLVSRYVNGNPAMWMYEQHALESILERDFRPHQPVIKRIVDPRGRTVAAFAENPAAPLVSRAATIYDAGNAVASVAIVQSARPILLQTALVGGLSVVLGFTVWWAMSVIPLAALRRTLDALSQEKERAHVTLAAIAEAVVATDLEGTIELLNRGAVELAGISGEGGRGRPFGEIFRLRERATGLEWRPPWKGLGADHGTAWVLEDASGRPHVVTLVAAAVGDAAGPPTGYVIDMRDVTERERLEGELARAQRLESIGVLAGGIAHDFNNLLTAIMGSVDVALRDPTAPPAVAKRLTAAVAACERARDLTQQLLTFSRGGAPVRKTVNLGQMIRETTQFCSSGASGGLQLDIPADLWAVDADEGQLSQVLQNLVINAHQATPGGRSVTVQAANVQVGASAPLPLTAGRYVRIHVEDQGGGIAPEDIGRIFDPYFTKKADGKGLGLAVAHSIVTKHGGVITVDSVVGEGSRFSVYLPAKGVLREGPPSPSPAPKASGGRLLLMDDDDFVRDAAAEVFAHLGYEVTSTRDGREALERHEEAARAGHPFDLIVLDLTIPGGMGGEETARWLRERDPEAILVASSGYSGTGTLADYQARGFDQILNKPYRLEDARKTFAALDSLREARRGARFEVPTTRPP